jgi:hypothetical protein
MSPTRSTALASEIRHFAGWHLLVNCPRCRELRPLDVNTLIPRVGAEKLLGDVVRRLRCQTCGTAPSWVKLAHSTEGAARPQKSGAAARGRGGESIEYRPLLQLL